MVLQGIVPRSRCSASPPIARYQSSINRMKSPGLLQNGGTPNRLIGSASAAGATQRGGCALKSGGSAQKASGSGGSGGAGAAPPGLDPNMMEAPRSVSGAALASMAGAAQAR